MLKAIKIVLTTAIIVAVTVWGAFALYFGDSQASQLQSALAVGFAFKWAIHHLCAMCATLALESISDFWHFACQYYCMVAAHSAFQ